MSVSVDDIVDKYSNPGSQESLKLQDLENVSTVAWKRLGDLLTDKVVSEIDAQGEFCCCSHYLL